MISQNMPQDLTPITLSHIASRMVAGTADRYDMISTLTALAQKGETSEEIFAFVQEFGKASIKVRTHHDCVADLCGTGGASFRTFNISTISSFVVSACDVPVAKHGNRSANGLCGSADLLQALGANTSIGPELAGRMLDEIGITFLHAQQYHPAMRNVSQVRKDIGMKTVFNIIGPLLNPVEAEKRQLMGVYHPRLLDVVPGIMRDTGAKRALIVHGFPGMDEVSTLGQTEAVLLNGNKEERFTIDPKDLGFDRPRPDVVSELHPELAAKVAHRILSGSPGPRRDIVVLNSACALFAYGRVKTIESGIDMARGAIDSGLPEELLREFIQMSRAES